MHTPFHCCYKASTVFKSLKKRLRNGTHNDTVLAYVDIGANLGCVDNTVLFYEDMITNVEREKSHPVTGELFVQLYNIQTDLQHLDPKITLWTLLSSCITRGRSDTKED